MCCKIKGGSLFHGRSCRLEILSGWVSRYTLLIIFFQSYWDQMDIEEEFFKIHCVCIAEDCLYLLWHRLPIPPFILVISRKYFQMYLLFPLLTFCPWINMLHFLPVSCCKNFNWFEVKIYFSVLICRYINSVQGMLYAYPVHDCVSPP